MPPPTAASPKDISAQPDPVAVAMPVQTHDQAAAIRLPFWLHPLFLLICTLGIPVLATCYLSAEVFQTEWKSQKYFSLADAWLIGRFIGAFAGGILCFAFLRAWLAASGYRLTSPHSLAGLEVFIRRAFWVTATLCLLGSAIWTAYSARQGVSLADARAALSGQSNAIMRIREKAETIPGVTTLTQFGMAAAVLAGLGWFGQRSRALRVTLIGIMIIALLRGFLRAERLAFIEVAVPFFISLLPELISRFNRRFYIRLGLPLVPVAALLGLIGFFVVAEAGRSYEAKAEEGARRSAVEYGAVRLGGYYGTSLNNGAYLLENLPRSNFPHFTLEWLWRFPGFRMLADPRAITGVNSAQIISLLSTDLNAEFNNPSGIFMYIHDFGRIGILPVAFGLGIVLAALYHGFRQGTPAGRLLYPLLVVGLLEISRIPYLTSNRAFPSMFFLVALSGTCLLRRAKRRSTFIPQ